MNRRVMLCLGALGVLLFSTVLVLAGHTKEGVEMFEGGEGVVAFLFFWTLMTNEGNW